MKSPSLSRKLAMLSSWSLPWQQCLTAFLQGIFDLSGSASSLDTYTSTLTRFFSLCNKAPDAVSRTDVLGFMNSPSTSRRNPGETVSASCKNQRLCVIKSFYKFASLYEADDVPLYDKSLPTTGLRYYKRDIDYRAMNAQELEAFFSVIPTDTVKGVRDRALFLLYFLLGRRRSELYRLTWRDIESAVIVDENGNRRASHVYRYYGKGRARQVRTKELPDYAYRVLCHYLEYAGRLATIQPGDVLFVSTNPGQGHRGSVHGSKGANRPLNHNTINTIFRTYCRAAGLDPKFSLHSLRHSSAHARYEEGEDLRSIQHLLDHSSIATTDLYLRTMAGVADKSAAALEKRFGHLSR